MLRRSNGSRLLAGAVISAALLFAFASSALAAPSDRIMTFTDLRSALTTGPLTGYMKTVVSETLVNGSDITTIPLTVEAVPLSGTAYDDNSLIAFEATGALIAQYGGIVEGMSGSPIYVHTADGDKLIGAVSYGDAFTLGGGGLATPIEAMSQIESQRGSAVVPLSQPVISSNGVYDKVIVAPNPQDYKAAAAQGAFVARPLSAVSLGGLRTSSSRYKGLVKDLAARGITTAAQITPLSSAAEPSFSTEMTGGASVGVWATRGDLWYGGIGTVTYVNGDNVLAFGHSAFFTGTTSLFMTNASVEKVWRNAAFPFKLADPGATRGVITQDRNKGILGKLGTYANETTITAHAIDADNPGTETTSAVYIPRQLITNGFADSYLVGTAAYVAGSKLFDSQGQAGSAHTTTTVVVRDVHDTTYTITIPNYTDSTYDIASDAANDVSNAIATLQSTLSWGTDKLTVISVDLTGEYSAHRASSTIVGVEAPNGLHVGANHLVVETVNYGVDDTKTIDATLTIPAGTALGGSLTAAQVGYSDGSDDGTWIYTSSGMGLFVDNSYGRRSIAQLADSLNKTLPNNTIEIEFDPSPTGSDFFDDEPSPALSTKPIVLDVNVDLPVTGEADVNITTINAVAQPNPIAYNRSTHVIGTISGPSTDTTLALYATTAGSSSETLVATTTAKAVDGELTFNLAPTTRFTTNTTLRVHMDGSGSWSSADATILLGVQGIASLRSSASRITRGQSVRLTANMSPTSAAGGTVVFERLVGRRWTRIATKTLNASAAATLSWKPARGTQKVRMRYLGGTYNAATTSAIRTIVVR